jgi:hypothetical protein
LEAKLLVEDAQREPNSSNRTARKLERAGLHLETDEADAVGDKSLKTSGAVVVRKREAGFANVKSG